MLRFILKLTTLSNSVKSLKLSPQLRISQVPRYSTYISLSFNSNFSPGETEKILNTINNSNGEELSR